MRDAGDVPGHELLRPAHRAQPQRHAAGRRDAHAVGPDDGDVALGGARGDASRHGATLGARLGAQAGQHDRAHARGDDVLEGRLRARVPDQEVGALRLLRERRQRGEALAAEHGGPVGVHEPGGDSAAQHLLELGCALGRAVARADDRERAREEQGADPAAQLGRRHGTSAPSQVSASAGSSPPWWPRLSCSNRPGSRHQASTPARGSTTMSPTRSRKRAEMRGPNRPSAASCAVGATHASSPKRRLEQAERVVERALAHVQEEIPRRARGSKRAAVGAAPQERHELRTALVDVDAALRVGRQLAVVGEQQHERAGRARERVDQFAAPRPRAARARPPPSAGRRARARCPMVSKSSR